MQSFKWIPRQQDKKKGSQLKIKIEKKMNEIFIKLQIKVWTQSDRGDVPGWVLVVLMTAGLVTGIWTVAAPRLNTLLRNSLDSMNAIR